MEKCYCVFESDEFGEGSILLAVFKSEEKAKKYEEIHTALEPDYNFWIREYSYEDEHVDETMKVAKYYTYIIDLEEPFDLETIDETNSFYMEADPEVYTTDDYVEIYDSAIEGYSVKSYIRARKIALDYYNVLQNKKKVGRYKVIDRRTKNESECN